MDNFGGYGSITTLPLIAMDLLTDKVTGVKLVTPGHSPTKFTFVKPPNIKITL